MTFDLDKCDLWPCQQAKVPMLHHNPSLVPLRLSTFQMRQNFTFSAYLKVWPQTTFDLDMWPLTTSTNASYHVTIYDSSLVEIHHSMWMLEPNVYPVFTTDKQGTKQSLCIFPAKGSLTQKEKVGPIILSLPWSL